MTDSAAIHPDFIITVDGQDVTSDCLKWTISDKEEGTGHLDVTMDNSEGKHNGKFKKDQMLCIRFGHAGNLSAKVELSIQKIHDHFGHGGLTRTLVGLDATHKLQGKTGRGQQKGTKIKPAVDQLAKETGTEIDLTSADEGDDGKGDKCTRQPCLGNTLAADQLQDLLNQSKSDKGNDSSGEEQFDLTDDSPEGKLLANRTSASGVNPDDKAEKNRMDNASNRAKSTGLKATLKLVGYPLLKAKCNMDVQNVGDWSGQWYVQNCDHSWHKGSGYTTTAHLIKGKLGGGGGGGACCAQPMLFHGDMFKSAKAIYAGPRKSDGESQATFTFGDGKYIQSFDPSMDAQSGRGQGKETSGKTINPAKASDPVEEVKSGDSGSGSGAASSPSPTLGGGGYPGK